MYKCTCYTRIFISTCVYTIQCMTVRLSFLLSFLLFIHSRFSPFSLTPSSFSSLHSLPFALFFLLSIQYSQCILFLFSRLHLFSLSNLPSPFSLVKSPCKLEDWSHLPTNYKDTKAKCRHLTKFACKGTLRQVFIRYTHKTSGFKTSGFKTSGFKTSGFKTSGLQNVRFTKRQGSKRLVSKRPIFQFYIFIKPKVQELPSLHCYLK